MIHFKVREHKFVRGRQNLLPRGESGEFSFVFHENVRLIARVDDRSQFHRVVYEMIDPDEKRLSGLFRIAYDGSVVDPLGPCDYVHNFVLMGFIETMLNNRQPNT
jgi:hypothetical protein